MLGRLFGKKKEVKPQSLEEAKATLLENIREEALNANIGESFNHCLQLLEGENQEAIESLKDDVFALAQNLPLAQSTLALSVYCGLLERDFIVQEDVEKAIDLFESKLVQSLPFFQLLDKKVKQGEEGNQDYDIDVDSLYNELIKDRSKISEEEASAVLSVERFAQSFLNIISLDKSYIALAKGRLKDRSQIAINYSQACYWLSRLFDVLFDEPIVVIDIDNHIGFKGVMHGVADNYQLQHLLMGMPELSEHLAINEDALRVANGTGIHVSNFTLEGKWNMYNRDMIKEEDWQDIKMGPAKTFELQDYWIWGEGNPREISVHDGHRVVLLGRLSNKRPSKVQRAFKNVKADIEVEQMLRRRQYINIKYITL